MNDFEIEEFEKQLKGMHLNAPSSQFFANVETELSTGTDVDDIENSLKKLKPIEPSEEFYSKIAAQLEDDSASAKRGITIPFPRWLSAAAAAALAATGILIWQQPNENNSPSNSDLAARVSAAAEKPHYQLVSTESSLNDVEELPIETREDGTLVRPIRYIYTNTKRWEDPKTQKRYVEHHPYEKIVPTLVAVY